MDSIQTPDKTDNISKFNAVKHAVLQKTLLEFEIERASQLQDELAVELKPEGMLELLLVEKIVIARMRYERAVMIEKQHFDYQTDPPMFNTIYEKRTFVPRSDPSDPPLYPPTQTIQIGGGVTPVVTTKEMEQLEKTFMRYITACERQFYRALHELQRIQAVRKGQKPTSIAVDFMHDNQNEN